jgi:hypothetical protein
MEDITLVFNDFIAQYGSVDIAESEFKMRIHEDPELHALYRQWCEDVGSSEKDGFLDYCDEYLDSQNDVWNTLNDYDNE